MVSQPDTLKRDYEVLQRILDLLGQVTAQETVDDICRTIVEGVRAELSFDRAGLHLWLKDEGIFRGTFGTDINGETSDEHDLWWRGEGWPAMEKIKRGDVFIEEEMDQPPPRPGEENLKAHMVVLRFGEEIYGILSVDNRISRRLITEHELKYLTLFSRILGNAVELSRAREALLHSEERFRQVAANSREWIWELDAEGRYTYSSDMAVDIVGYEPGELSGQELITLVCDDDREEIKVALDYARSGRRGIQRLRNKQQHKDGRTIVVETSAHALMDEAGQCRGYRGAHRDITREMQREQELQEAQRLEAVGRLAGGVAHYFNNLLTCILGCTSLIMEHLGEDSSAQEDLKQIQDAGEEAASLAQQLLAFSRKQMLLVRKVNINEVLASLERLLRKTLGRNIVLTTNLQGGLDPITADENQLKEVILQIAINARAAMANAADEAAEAGVTEGGFQRYGDGQSQLIIETSNVVLTPEECQGRERITPGRYVLISIQDTGVGMPEHVREHLFEPFFTTQDVGGGSGLGMASVYGTVTQMGGDITVDSSPGEGTTFRILLPTAAKAAFETHDGSAMGKMHLRKTRETILLVHDAPKARATTKHMLDLLGYSTLSVGSLKEALQQLSGHSKEADLAIIDTGLPNMTGRQFLTELAAQGHELPGLLIKSKTAADTVTGQDMVFLRAPFDRDMLEDKIREALGDTD